MPAPKYRNVFSDENDNTIEIPAPHKVYLNYLHEDIFPSRYPLGSRSQHRYVVIGIKANERFYDGHQFSQSSKGVECPGQQCQQKFLGQERCSHRIQQKGTSAIGFFVVPLNNRVVI